MGEVGDEITVALLVTLHGCHSPLVLRDNVVDVGHQRLQGPVHQLQVDRGVRVTLTTLTQLPRDGAQLPMK